MISGLVGFSVTAIRYAKGGSGYLSCDQPVRVKGRVVGTSWLIFHLLKMSKHSGWDVQGKDLHVRIS